MCLAIPAKLIEITGDEGRVLLGDAKLKVSLVLIEDPAVGDWLLVHAGFAIERLSEEAARETFEMLSAMAEEEPL